MSIFQTRVERFFGDRWEWLEKEVPTEYDGVPQMEADGVTQKTHKVIYPNMSYDDADVRKQEIGGVECAYMRVPKVDSETETEYDVDGDRAYQRIEMRLCKVEIFGEMGIYWIGFVNHGGGYGKTWREERKPDKWRPETWHSYLRREEA